jgi:plasmid stabilization system protein ParE
MARIVQILDEAATETHEAWVWFLERSERVAKRFQQAIEDAIEQICDDPDRWPEYLHGTRIFTSKRFPYLVVFRHNDVEIQIIAVAHGHRNEGYWKLPNK